MPFQLRLATAPGQIIGALSIALEGGPFADTVTFGSPGTTVDRDYNVPSGSGPFNLQVYYFVDHDRVHIGITNVADNDVLSVVAVPNALQATGAPQNDPVLFLGSLWHSAGPPQQGYCIITCQDGTSNECCVVCRTGRAVTKTCC
jgi:hypothetical protein